MICLFDAHASVKFIWGQKHCIAPTASYQWGSLPHCPHGGAALAVSEHDHDDQNTNVVNMLIYISKTSKLGTKICIIFHARQFIWYEYLFVSHEVPCTKNYTRTFVRI